MRIARLLCGVAMVFAAAGALAQATHQPDAAENSGQDPTQPVTRVDLREKYQDNPDGAQAVTLTLRADKPFVLGGGWKLNTRIDLPVLATSAVTPANPTGMSEWGVSDILLQALAIAPIKGKTAFAFGTQLIVPSGADVPYTTGKWQLVPSAAIVQQLPEISRGTFIGLLVRDSFSFAGKKDRAGINVVSVQPLFNWQLPQAWFVTLGPEAKFDTRNGWKLFVPFDATIGKKLTPKSVASLQIDAPLVEKYRQYDWQVEARIGIFF
jgi:hypothetical protein